MCMGEWRVINEQKVAASGSKQERLIARSESVPPQTEQARDKLPTSHRKG